MVSTCKDCRHWGDDNQGETRMCANPKCEVGYFGYGTKPDGFGGTDGVYTGPDFGCVLFEPREAQS